VIRKVDANGTITTVVGTGVQGHSNNVPPLQANLSCPLGIALDQAGNLYIADSCTGLVQIVDQGFTKIVTVAGGGTANPGDGGPATNAKLEQPIGLAFDSIGNLYIADCTSGLVRKVSSDKISTVVGGGTAGTQLNCPEGITFDKSDNLYIAE
jgi:DNA-binding beta-propeller fold protein YncE